MKREFKTHPINRALAFIEEHLAEEIRVNDIAQYSAISQYHLNRVFAYATGYSLARYVRVRRLTEAAKQLLQSDKSILTVALDVGYDSHATFTRAFKAEFGISPNDFRRNGDKTTLKLINPIYWRSTMNISVPTPREEAKLSLTLVGLHERFTGDNDNPNARIENMGKWILSRIPSILHLTEPGYCQYCFNVKDHATFDFFVGLSVSKVGKLPKGMTNIEIKWDRYLAFPFSLKASELKDFIMVIFMEWFPNSNFKPADGTHIQWFKPDPNWKLHKPEDWKSQSDQHCAGEIWIPIK